MRLKCTELRQVLRDRTGPNRKVTIELCFHFIHFQISLTKKFKSRSELANLVAFYTLRARIFCAASGVGDIVSMMKR
jgi:hypothetical protein